MNTATRLPEPPRGKEWPPCEHRLQVRRASFGKCGEPASLLYKGEPYCWAHVPRHAWPR